LIVASTKCASIGVNSFADATHASCSAEVERNQSNHVAHFGFALIWHIWWMAGAGAIGIFLTMLAFAFRNEEEIKVPAEQIARFEQVNQAEIAV